MNADPELRLCMYAFQINCLRRILNMPYKDPQDKRICMADQSHDVITTASRASISIHVRFSKELLQNTIIRKIK